ncbi:MAG: DUF167 domain-containing protein [Blastocatellia bacterium]
MIQLTEKDGAVTFAVRVQPRASRTEIAGEIDTALKIRLAAPPVDGAANRELIQFLASKLGVSKQQVEILTGVTGKNKIIRVRGLSASLVSARLS